MKQKILLTALLTGLTLGLSSCDKPATPAPSGETASTTNAPTATSAKAGAEFEKLKGKWERPDGGYILEIRAVDAGGKLDAGYFNPSPIHVARALAYREAGETKVFVELQDVNYPGCTYKLALDAKNDQLVGQYFQASQQQTYDITFARLK
ncbi:MAG: hypothetical protein EXS35_16415 [Pedosphaera sp.]|nr:hypothetical protein [Pedosphaera sp.]